MGRPAIFDRPMTVAERKRRQRAREGLRTIPVPHDQLVTEADLTGWSVAEARDDGTANDEPRRSA